MERPIPEIDLNVYVDFAGLAQAIFSRVGVPGLHIQLERLQPGTSGSYGGLCLDSDLLHPNARCAVKVSRVFYLISKSHLRVAFLIQMLYYIIMMKVPSFIVQEADSLAKETGLNFRDCLDLLMRMLTAKTPVKEDRVYPLQHSYRSLTLV
jgi:hypothetical protein